MKSQTYRVYFRAKTQMGARVWGQSEDRVGDLVLEQVWSRVYASIQHRTLKKVNG